MGKMTLMRAVSSDDAEELMVTVFYGNGDATRRYVLACMHAKDGGEGRN